MNGWANDGKPLTDGRFCYIIDPEDGTHAIRVYGRTQDEVFTKMASQVEHGQRFVARAKNTAKPLAFEVDAVRPAPSLPQQRKLMTADERMQATADLENPARSGEAISRLMEDATGFNFREEAQKRAVREFANLCQSWEQQRPEFPTHPINRELVANKAVILAGGKITSVTAQHLDSAFQSLQASGMLVSAEEEFPGDEIPLPTPTVRPDETPAPRTVRPRGATSYSRTSLRAAQPVASPRQKYTRAQIDEMSSAEVRRKMVSEPGFAELVALYKTQSRKATA